MRWCLVRFLPQAAAHKRSFGVAQAERLLWRAGFGPRKGEAEALARLGLDGAVRALTNPGGERLVGPAPKDEKGRPLAPYDAWGHDHVWWLDRMVRTSRPLVERMTLVWHDWFATSNSGVGSQRLMLNQNQLLREHGLGSFQELLLAVTKDPAMLLWLNGSDNSKRAPNENYAREMMELFALGAGRGYSEARRPPAGPRAHRLPERLEERRRQRQLPVRPAAPRRGRQDDLSQARGVHMEGRSPPLGHPSRPSGFFVGKLWGYFVPVPPTRATQRSLERLYVSSGYKVKPVVAAILKHPGALRGRTTREAARGVHGRSAAPHRPADRHDVVDVDRRDGGPAALLSAERRGLGRLALARHRDVARPLVDGAERPATVRTRSRKGVAALRRGEAARRRTRILEPPDAHPTTRAALLGFARLPSPMRAAPRGSASSTP